MAEEYKKPPLGLRPREVADHEHNVFRMGEILGAMARYSAAEKPIPMKWIAELTDRISEALGTDVKQCQE